MTDFHIEGVFDAEKCVRFYPPHNGEPLAFSPGEAWSWGRVEVPEGLRGYVQQKYPDLLKDATYAE